MKQESQSRQIQGYTLTIKLSSQKLSIRALQNETNDLYICEYPHGHLPQDIRFFYQNEEEFFDALMTEEVCVREGSLILPYTTFKKNRPVKREFVIALTKIEANEIEVLRRKVSKLEAQNQKIPQMQQKIDSLLRMVEKMEDRTGFYSFNPGVFRKLTFNLEDNELYKMRSDFLTRRPYPPNYYSNSISAIDESIISYQPIGEEHTRISYKLKIFDVPEPQIRAFIGLCVKAPENMKGNFIDKTKFMFIINTHFASDDLRKRLQLAGRDKQNECKLYQKLKHNSQETFGRYTEPLPIRKDDTLVMTVDLENCHITWYRNELSLERCYFAHPGSNIYPFVYLQPNVEVQL